MVAPGLDRPRGKDRNIEERVIRDARLILSENRGARPFDQGYDLARWYREKVLHVNDTDAVQPEAHLGSLNIKIDRIRLNDRNLEAVCVWGPNHGPAVFLNSRGRYSSGDAGRRATLAHELCHILIDRDGALSFAEALGGWTPRNVEARARAFAAELLIPKQVAGTEFQRGRSPSAIMTRLKKEYGASREVIAWQARNSGKMMAPSTSVYLQQCVSTPERFS